MLPTKSPTLISTIFAFTSVIIALGGLFYTALIMPSRLQFLVELNISFPAIAQLLIKFEEVVIALWFLLLIASAIFFFKRKNGIFFPIIFFIMISLFFLIVYLGAEIPVQEILKHIKD